MLVEVDQVTHADLTLEVGSVTEVVEVLTVATLLESDKSTLSHVFNVLNHTNFANPVSNQSSANFGKITQTVGSAVATAVGTAAGPLGGELFSCRCGFSSSLASRALTFFEAAQCYNLLDCVRLH